MNADYEWSFGTRATNGLGKSILRLIRNLGEISYMLSAISAFCSLKFCTHPLRLRSNTNFDFEEKARLEGCGWTQDGKFEMFSVIQVVRTAGKVHR